MPSEHALSHWTSLERGLSQGVLARRMSERTGKAIARALQYLVWVGGLYFGIYHVLDLNFKTLAASLGVVSVAIAFSSQQIVQSIIAGFLISIRRPIWYEDWVEIGSSGICRVKDLTATQTVLRSADGRVIYLPNATALSSSLVNYSRSGLVEVAIPVAVKPGANLQLLRDLALEIAERNPNIAPNVKGLPRGLTERFTMGPGNHIDLQHDLRFHPRVVVSEIGHDKTALSVRIWIAEIQRRPAILSEFLEELLGRFGKSEAELV